MLQKLNERIQGIVAWVVIILIAITFTLFGVDYYMQSQQVSDDEVTVNGEGVTKQTFEVNYRRVRQQHGYEQVTTASDNVIKKQVLENLIVSLVTVQSASKDGFLVSPEQAKSAIGNIPQFQEDGQFSQQRYLQALNAAMYTPDTFQNQVRQGMLLSQQRFSMMGTAFALPNEINRFVKLYMQTRDYEYLIIPSKQFVKSVQINEADISNYYNTHKSEFIEPEKVSIEYTRLSMPQIREHISVSEADIQRYYQENESSFLTPVEWQVENILFALPENASVKAQDEVKQRADSVYQILLKKPAQFSKLAIKLSQDQSAALVNTLFSDKAVSETNEMSVPNMPKKKGNTARWIIAGTTPLDKALAPLTTPGEIAAPYRTENGYEIFKLVATKKPRLKPFDEVKQEIKTQLTNELVQANYTQALEQLTDLSYQTPDSLQPVAEALNLPIEKSVLFSKNNKNNPFTENVPVVNAVFSHDVLDLGNNSEPVQLDNESVIVLRINQHQPASKKKFADVRDQIGGKLRAIKAQIAAQQFGKSLIQTIDAEKEKELINQQHLAWKAVDNAARDSDESEALISELAFNLPHVNVQEGQALTNGDYAIVRLHKIHYGEYQSLDKEQQASLVQQIEASYGVMDYNLYVNSLVDSAKIERHDNP